MPSHERANPPSPITISEATYKADRKKYMDLTIGDGQVIVKDAKGVTILILGRGTLPPVREDWPEPVYEIPSEDPPEVSPGLGWLD